MDGINQKNSIRVLFDDLAQIILRSTAGINTNGFNLSAQSADQGWSKAIVAT